jgi:Tol biopolymer transport system component
MNDQFRERGARWSPDGNSIAFHSDRDGKFQIWMVNADGSGLRQITRTLGVTGGQSGFFT